MDITKAVSESTNEVVVSLRSTIGISNTIALIKKCGGAFLYVPQMKTVLKSERDKAVFNAFNEGMNFRQIALKFEISELTARDIVQSERRKERERKQEQRSGAVRAGAGNRSTGAADSSGTGKPVIGAGGERPGTD